MSFRSFLGVNTLGKRYAISRHVKCHRQMVQKSGRFT